MNLLLLFVILNIVDLATTAIGFSLGATEKNPILAASSIYMIAFYKLIGIIAISYIAYIVSKTHPHYVRNTLVLGVLMYSAAMINNFYQIGGHLY